MVSPNKITAYSLAAIAGIFGTIFQMTAGYQNQSELMTYAMRQQEDAITKYNRFAPTAQTIIGAGGYGKFLSYQWAANVSVFDKTLETSDFCEYRSQTYHAFGYPLYTAKTLSCTPER